MTKNLILENLTIEHQEVSINGKRIAVKLKQQATKKPTIVMVHPIASSMQLEDQLQFPDWRECGVTHSLLRYDAPGHGLSHLEHDYKNLTWQALAKTLCLLLDQLAIKQVVLAGSSMGAGVALHTAMMASDFNIEIAGLALIIPPMSGKERQLLSKIYQGWANTVRTKGSTELVRLWRAAAPNIFFEREFPEAREICFHDFSTRDMLSMAAAFEAAAMSDFPESKKIEGISCPVQILARIDDPIHPIEAAEKLAFMLPQRKLSIATNSKDIRAWPNLLTDFVDSL